MADYGEDGGEHAARPRPDLRVIVRLCLDIYTTKPGILSKFKCLFIIIFLSQLHLMVAVNSE